MSDHLTPENIDALAFDLEAVSHGESDRSVNDRDWIVASAIIAKVIRHYQSNFYSIGQIVEALNAADADQEIYDKVTIQLMYGTKPGELQ